jgi:hypothetical protein
VVRLVRPDPAVLAGARSTILPWAGHGQKVESKVDSGTALPALLT